MHLDLLSPFHQGHQLVTPNMAFLVHPFHGRKCSSCQNCMEGLVRRTCISVSYNYYKVYEAFSSRLQLARTIENP